MSDLEKADPPRLDVFSEAEQPTSCIELGCLQVAGDRSTSAVTAEATAVRRGPVTSRGMCCCAIGREPCTQCSVIARRASHG